MQSNFHIVSMQTIVDQKCELLCSRVMSMKQADNMLISANQFDCLLGLKSWTKRKLIEEAK